MKDSATKFSPITITLHWLVGLGMIVLLAVGIYMSTFEVYALYDIHKSFGILIILLVIPRIIWRMINGWPTPVGNNTHMEHLIAKAVHWLLIIGTLLMPVSGMMMSGAGGHGLFVFGVELLAENHDPSNPRIAVPYNAAIAQLGHTLHGIVGYILVAAVVLHVVGALKHHIIDKDATLRRMLGRDA